MGGPFLCTLQNILHGQLPVLTFPYASNGEWGKKKMVTLREGGNTVNKYLAFLPWTWLNPTSEVIRTS